MAWPVLPHGFLGASGDNDTYQIQRSLRFNSADSAHLNRTPASAGNRKTWTWSGWVKIGALSQERIFLSNTDTSGRHGLYFGFRIPNTLEIGDYGYSSYDWVLTTSALFRDTSAWYHIVASIDTTQATTSNRVRLYINGGQINSFSASTYPSQNSNLQINSTSPMSVGRVNNNTYFFDGYLAEINFIDGHALTPSSFGETDAITGRWKAKAFTGSYGTNGFYLNFSDNSNTTAATLGKDYSGNGNNWTPNNFSVTAGAGNDSLVDVPTNWGLPSTNGGGEVRGNYATLNPVSTIRGTIIDGNLRTNGGDRGSIATIGMSSGKWFCEMYVTAVGAESSVGISAGLNVMNTYVGVSSDSWGYYYSGLKYNNTSGASYGSSYTSGDTIGVAFDADAGTLIFTKNGVSQGTAYSSLTSGPYYFAVGGRSATSANDVTMNFGQQAWKYAPPSGFKALCTTNLPTPVIEKPSSYMDVVTYTGTGATQTISGLGFSPDLLWTKGRNLAESHNIFDTQRSGKRLRSDQLFPEASTTVTLGANGFTLGTESENNNNGSTFVAWCWDAGSSTVSNTQGSITSQVRANISAGFSIVTATCAGGTNSYGHGLGVKPAMYIVKNLSNSQNWQIWHQGLSNETIAYLQFNVFGEQTYATMWAASTSTTFSLVGDGPVVVGNNFVAYVFAPVAGYSFFGSYTGNGSADGPFVYCGFRPRWVMHKRKNAEDTLGWLIYDSARDSFNVGKNYLVSNIPNTENFGGSTATIDFLSNGFKLRLAGNDGNATGVTYIFAAFAETPFKYARAR
jgi:hypothetical protein